MPEETPAPNPSEPTPAPAVPATNDAASAALKAAQAAIAAARSINAMPAGDAAAGGGGGSAGSGGGGGPSAQTAPLDMPSFSTPAVNKAPEGIDLLGDVNLQVKIELGRTRMLVEDVLRLGEGSVVELDKLAGDPVDVYVNGRPVARGEVLVLNDNFCVRINEIIGQVKNDAA